jgi:hypothetical protein
VVLEEIHVSMRQTDDKPHTLLNPSELLGLKETDIFTGRWESVGCLQVLSGV